MEETKSRMAAEAEASEKARATQEEPITMAVVGRGGAGKSSTVNSIVGKLVAPVSHTPAEGTLQVREYPGESNGFQFRIFDTPGFGSTRTTSNAILDELAEKVGARLQILLYVVPLTLTRLDRIDKSAIRLLHQAFSGNLWEHVVVVFTHADVFGERFAERVDAWKKSLSAEVMAVAGNKAADAVGFVVISNGRITNPDGREWMGELFTTVVEKIGSPLAYIASQFRRIHKKGTNNDTLPDGSTSDIPPIRIDDSQRQRMFRRVVAFTGCTTIGMGLGAIAGPPGILVGAAVGALVGWILGDSV